MCSVEISGDHMAQGNKVKSMNLPLKHEMFKYLVTKSGERAIHQKQGGLSLLAYKIYCDQVD